MQYILKEISLKLEVDYTMERRLYNYDRDKDVITKRRDKSSLSDLLNGTSNLRR